MQPNQPTPTYVPVVQPAPVPTIITFDVISMNDGRRAIAMGVHDVTGTHMTILASEDAAKVSQQLADKSREAASGIVVARNGHVPPNGQSPRG
jgi:hypothetical protein